MTAIMNPSEWRVYICPSIHGKSESFKNDLAQESSSQ